MLHNSVGVGGSQLPRKKCITKVYSSMLLALQGGGWRSNSQEKSFTLEWPPNTPVPICAKLSRLLSNLY